MKTWLLSKLINILIAQLSTELLREFGQKMVAWTRKKVEDSETKTDDKILLPIVGMLDEILENDEE